MMEDFCEKRGLRHEHSTPHTPQQNGERRAEDWGTHQCGGVHAALGANVSIMVGGGVLHACHLVNKRFTSSLPSMTPEESLTGKAQPQCHTHFWMHGVCADPKGGEALEDEPETHESACAWGTRKG